VPHPWDKAERERSWPSDCILCEDEKCHPCKYLSKGLNDVERNYDVHDKEMLGII
jgi:hypothetical protein